MSFGSCLNDEDKGKVALVKKKLVRFSVLKLKGYYNIDGKQILRHKTEAKTQLCPFSFLHSFSIYVHSDNDLMASFVGGP